MSYPVLRLSIVLAFIILTIPLKLIGQVPNVARQLKTVVIDPGHGGHDPGAVAGGVREKDLVLSVALRLGNMIKNGYPDVTVIYTRSKDVFIPLYERAYKAIRNKADVFISIHANYVSQSVVKGTETFTLGLHRSQENLDVAKKENSVILLEEDYSSNYQGFDPNETESYIMFENMQSEYQSQSIALAANVQDAFTQNLGLMNRGVKQAGFLVLRQTSMPSVLIEIGFISNPSERKFLTSDSGKEKISESIYKAFSGYKKMIDLKSRFDIPSESQNTASTDIRGTSNIEIQTEARGENPGNQTPGTSETHSNSTDPQPQNSPDSLNNQKSGAVFPDMKKENPESTSSTIASGYEKNNQTPGNVRSGMKIRSGSEDNKVYYSVQVGAVKVAFDPSPANFKGEKNIFRVKVEPFFKFFSGRFQTTAEAFTEKTRLKNKYPDAFVVVFENDVPRLYKKK